MDKLIPAEIIEKRLNMLSKETPEDILFKSFIIGEAVMVENLILTGVFKTEYRSILCEEIYKNRKNNIFFLKQLNSNAHIRFYKIIKDNNLESKTLFEAFNKLTPGGKILLIQTMDRNIVSSLITSKNISYTKKELILYLESCKKLRNHVAHNMFVLNKGPYLHMNSNVSKTLKLEEDFFI